MTNGYVILKQNSQTPVIASVTNGAFSFNTLYCPQSTGFSLQGADYDTLDYTDEITYDYVPTNTVIGNLPTCNSSDQFITTQINNDVVNNPLILTNIEVIADASSFRINGYTLLGQLGTYIISNVTTPGTYTTADGFNYLGQSFYIENGIPNNMYFRINKYGAVGDFIDMTIYGTLSNGNLVNTAVHVKRTN